MDLRKLFVIRKTYQNWQPSYHRTLLHAVCGRQYRFPSSAGLSGKLPSRSMYNWLLENKIFFVSFVFNNFIAASSGRADSLLCAISIRKITFMPSFAFNRRISSFSNAASSSRLSVLFPRRTNMFESRSSTLFCIFFLLAAFLKYGSCSTRPIWNFWQIIPFWMADWILRDIFQ